ncbi:MAG: hypothetical protein COB53_02570 [Elusimicrobia bacterium]|nr:MAG: hypothetical protein COB53_02570 [Elusimicrobiota bacterium]
MMRRSKVHVAGIIFHAYNRGNNRETVFHDDADHTIFLMILEKAREKFDFRLYAFCLMPNHFHLLLEVGEIPLWKIMHWMQLKYAIYYNKRYDHTGHVFQERFKSTICAKNSYFLELLRYIHLNPVRAKLCDDVLDFRWSSAKAYFEPPGDIVVDVKFPLSIFAPDPENARTRLLEFFREGIGIDSNKTDPQKMTAQKLPSLNDILATISRETLINEQTIKSDSRQHPTARARKLFISSAYDRGHHPQAISAYLNCSLSTIYKSIKPTPA